MGKNLVEVCDEVALFEEDSNPAVVCVVVAFGCIVPVALGRAQVGSQVGGSGGGGASGCETDRGWGLRWAGADVS